MTPPAPGTPMRRIPQETAEWVFSYDGGHDSQEAFESCLQVLDGALDVLQRHELLAPRSLARLMILSSTSVKLRTKVTSHSRCRR